MAAAAAASSIHARQLDLLQKNGLSRQQMCCRQYYAAAIMKLGQWTWINGSVFNENELKAATAVSFTHASINWDWCQKIDKYKQMFQWCKFCFRHEHQLKTQKWIIMALLRTKYLVKFNQA